MSHPPATKLSPEFAAVFREQAGAAQRMSFDRFMQLALYHPKVGYYRSGRDRIGYAGSTDFFTASSSGPIFGELVVASCRSLLGSRRLGDFTFVEIGAESSEGILTGVSHPFARNQAVKVGQAIELSGQCIVFSNELFDAQPFRRFVFRHGQWQEIYVEIGSLGLAEVFVPVTPPATFPANSMEGYSVDAPLASVSLAETIVRQPWTGLFIACDYGKPWRELVEACPGGTARAYHRHQQKNDLVDLPGEQDLTCHVCWDWLVETLATNSFRSPTIESHESFFIRHATSVIAETSSAEATRFSQRKLALMQLLHPSHLGQKFQVLHALRD